jgi:hypothetical protein
MPVTPSVARHERDPAADPCGVPAEGGVATRQCRAPMQRVASATTTCPGRASSALPGPPVRQRPGQVPEIHASGGAPLPEMRQAMPRGAAKTAMATVAGKSGGPVRQGGPPDRGPARRCRPCPPSAPSTATGCLRATRSSVPATVQDPPNDAGALSRETAGLGASTRVQAAARTVPPDGGGPVATGIVEGVACADGAARSAHVADVRAPARLRDLRPFGPVRDRGPRDAWPEAPRVSSDAGARP